MKLIRLNQFSRVMILLAVLLEFTVSAQQSFLFTNSAPTLLPRRTSIIFIQCDGLGYGDLSCYGQTKFQTPNLDKLAAEGIMFTNYSIADASSRSQAALMLGKNPAHLRQRADVDIALAADEITVAQLLKNSGYHTGMIGEWNLGDDNSAGAPWKKGFDEFAGYLDYDGVPHFYTDYIFRYAPRAIFDSTNMQFNTYVGREELHANVGGKKGSYIPDVLTRAAVNFIKINHPDEFNHYRPFFLLLNYEVPGGKIEIPTDAPYSGESWPQPEKNKAALISQIDDHVGQLREQLGNLGMSNNVAIFFSSASVPQKTAETDPAFFHSNVSTNDFRVPLIVNWPGNVPAGQVSGLKCSAADFLPTATEIALLKVPADIDGKSLLPAMAGQSAK
ncbi:MAG TPA: sulfatase-like hydrolase/transferase [Verrucomicrobiae bacterium]|nr:sulfatase-like hydrolase/transferase [Verrucomicrobiae bacterium]